jgi:hypothetical protein
MHDACTNERADVHYFYGFCSVSCRLLLWNTDEVTHIAEHAKPVHIIPRQDASFPLVNAGGEQTTAWRWWRSGSSAVRSKHKQTQNFHDVSDKRVENFAPRWFVSPSKCTTPYTGRSGQPCTSLRNAANSAWLYVHGRWGRHHRRCADLRMLESANVPIIWFQAVTSFTNLAFYYTLGSLKIGHELDYSRCEHKFKSMAYFVIVLTNKFEINGFHIAPSST